MKKAKGIVSDHHPSPPKLSEMRVWPLSTSVEVSWRPPPHGNVRGYQVAYGISIPDVYKIDVNASELHYIIENLEPEQEYIVSVRAYNKGGLGSPLYETVRTGRVKDSDSWGPLLLAPVAVKATTVSAYAIEVSWTDSSVLKLRGGLEEGAGKVYTVRYMQLNHLRKENKPRFVTVNSTQSPVNVGDLLPFTRYEFAVRVSHGNAKSVWSMGVTNTTFASTPSSKPAEFTADLQPSEPTTIHLTWQPPEEPNGPITGYVIFYSKDPVLPIDNWATLEIRGNRLSALVKDLDPNSAYFFKIQARNKEGVGPTTSPVTVTVPDVLPSAPRNLSSFSVDHNPTAVMLRWQRPRKVLQPITGYMVFYTDDPLLPERSWAVVEVKGDNSSSTIIRDLRPRAKYFFKLQAKNRAGAGPPTHPISVTLPDVAPTVPRNLTVREIASLPGAVNVSWLPPQKMDQPISGYLVWYRKENADGWSSESIMGDSDALSMIVPHLTPGATYQVKVQPQVDDRLGPSTPVVTFITPQDPSGEVAPPTDLRAFVLSSSAAVLSWRDPALTLGYHGNNNAATTTTTTPNANTSTYTVRYRSLLHPSPYLSPSKSKPTSPFSKSSSSSPFSLSKLSSSFSLSAARFSDYVYLSPPYFPSLYVVGLSPSTTYEFSVRVNRGKLRSEWSEPVFNTTLEAAPGSPPSNVSVTLGDNDPTVVTIAWAPPLSANGNITGYLIFSSTRRKLPLGEWRVQAVSGSQRRLTLRGLAPSTKYFFRLQARNVKGYGPLSHSLHYKTPAVHGSMVQDVTVVPSPDDPFSAIVSWQPPKKRKSRIAAYTVVCVDTEADETRHVDVSGEQLTAVVHQLSAAQEYRFTVQPRYRHSAGPHSHPVKYVVPKELLPGHWD